MPTVVLINSADPIFAFEHMMSHRRYMAAMSPLTRFSIVPYLLDPAYRTNVRAGSWHTNHQKAHTDFTTSLPSTYNALPTEIGLATAQPLMDADLSDAESLTWWTFVQHREHFLGDAAVLPLQNPVYPAW